MRWNRDVPAEACRDLVRGLGPGTACVAVTPGKAFACALPPLKLAGQGTRATAHLPLTVLMVAHTVLGLWLLSTARTG